MCRLQNYKKETQMHADFRGFFLSPQITRIISYCIVYIRPECVRNGKSLGIIKMKKSV